MTPPPGYPETHGDAVFYGMAGSQPIYKTEGKDHYYMLNVSGTGKGWTPGWSGNLASIEQQFGTINPANPEQASTAPVAGMQQPDPTQPTPAPVSTPTAPNQPATGQPQQPGQPQSQLSPEQLQQAYDQSGLTSLMGQAGLTPDQQAAVQAVYNATLANDESYSQRLTAAMQAAKDYSDPFFQAQITLVTDALQRNLASLEGNMQYQEQVAANTYADLQKIIERSQGQLTFQHEQELQNLVRDKAANLEGLQNDLAARGFTTSSIRTKKEGILEDVYSGMVESSNRSFQYQKQGYEDQLAAGNRDYQLQVQRLQQLAADNKLNLLRGAEETLGSDALAGLGYGDQALGNIGGEIPRQQALDQLSYGTNLVF